MRRSSEATNDGSFSISDTAFEAIGATVVVVGRNTALAQNPLQWFPALEGTWYGPEELRTKLKRLFATDPSRAHDARETLRAVFNPVNDETLQAFLPHEIPGSAERTRPLSAR